MNIYRHRSWLITIAQIYLPLILWGSFILILLIVGLSYLIRPIYNATTVLTLDSDLAKILQAVETSFPSVTAQDFIRYEYFATHNVQLMRAPQIAEKTIDKLNACDNRNKRLLPEYFVEPSLSKLLFSNDGQGIKIKWISDTQQFAIKGFSRDPDKAVLYSKEYTDFFLDENSVQFHTVLKKVAQRFALQRESLNAKINVLDSEIQQTLSRNETVDLETEITNLTEAMLNMKVELDESRFLEKSYQTRIQFLNKEAQEYEQLQDYERIMAANPHIQSMEEEIQELTGSLIRASVDYTRNHPEYKVIEKHIESVKESLKKEAEQTFYRQTGRRSSMFETVLSSMLTLNLTHLISQSRIEHLDSIINRYNKRLQKLLAARLRTSNLEGEKEALLNMKYNAVRQGDLINNILERSLPFFRVVSYARINKDDLKYYKFFPKRKRLLILTLITCLFGFSFLAIAKELSANTLFRGWQLASIENTTAFSEVPDLRLISRKPGVFEATCSQYIKEICLATRKSRIVRITSGTKGEGKATIARVLAGYHHRLGKSVVLIDGDFSHRSLTRFLQLVDQPGLSECVSGRNSIQDVIMLDQLQGISIIPAGSNFESEKSTSLSILLADTISAIATDYDMIIYIDSPFSDMEIPIEVMPSHDIGLVLKSGLHSIYEIERMIGFDKLAEGQTALKGIVINKVPFDADVFSLKGLAELTDYIVKWPFVSLGKLLRA